MHHLVFHADAVGRARGGALAADLAEVLDPDVDRLVRDQGHVGQEGVPEVHTGAEFFRDEHAVPAQLANAGGQGRGHRLDSVLDDVVAQLTNVGSEVGVDKLQLGLAKVMAWSPRMAMGLDQVVVPRGAQANGKGYFLASSVESALGPPPS
jgi:hypothetical protein